jgi:RHS repeat-associated protein
LAPNGAVTAGGISLNQPAGSTNTVTTTTQYDSVGRIVTVGYNDGFTPNKQFVYDTNPYWSQTATNLKGRLAVTGGGSGSTWNGALFSYDVMGRVINLWQCAPATCGTSNQAARPLSFAYDWAGNLIQESDGVSGTIVYGRSIAGEVTSITNETYQDLPYDPPNLVSNVVNGPDGPVSYTLGNGLNVYRSYDQLGRNAQQWVCNGPAAVNCNGGTAIYGTTSQWKGSQMQSQSDTVLNQGITFGYGDGFNRLTSRTVTSGTLQNYTYAYDRYGNRVSQTPLQGGYTFNPTINPVNNQITTSGYTYDAAGNMLNDGVHSYQYDAEGNLVQVDGGSTAKYVYDVFNQRVHVQTASATTEYIYDYAGRRVSGWLSPNNYGNQGRIYWDGQQIGFRSSNGTNFDHQDILGTERLRTTYSGAVGATYQSLPWGDGYGATVNNSGADQDSLHYADLEHDAESGTEHAQFRNYSSAQGRWLAPDPYMGSYDLTNPQSMNRYAYVLNNPTSLLDPSGLYLQPFQPGAEDPTCDINEICYAAGGGGSGGGGGQGRTGSTTPAPSKGITKAQAYCAADVTINYALGFIPGYNAAKLVGTLSGANFNFVQNLAAGKSIVTFDNGATIKDPLQGILWGANGLASTYSAVSTAAASGLDASDVIVKAAGTAGTIANLVNTASAAYSLYQCKDAN